MSQNLYQCKEDKCSQHEPDAQEGEKCLHPEGPLNGEDSIETRYNNGGQLQGCISGFKSEESESTEVPPDAGETEKALISAPPIKVDIATAVKCSISDLLAADVKMEQIPSVIKNLIISLSIHYAEEMGLDVKDLKKLGGIMNHYLQDLKLIK
jgi:hypothetical protein